MRPDFLACDVSFISLKLALPPALGLAAPGARAVLLVKPQFEAGRAAIGKGGVLRRPDEAKAIAEALRSWLDEFGGWRAIGLTHRPSREATATQSFCSAGSRTGEQPFRDHRLGAQGDGIAETETGPVFIPFTLPGEVVTAARAGDRAELIAVHRARRSASSRPAVISAPAAAARSSIWRRTPTRAGSATRSSRRCAAGIEAEVGDIVPCSPHTRRRVVLSARRTESGMLLGYNRALSHTIVDIKECPIAFPEIVAALGGLSELAGFALPQRPTLSG